MQHITLLLHLIGLGLRLRLGWGLGLSYAADEARTTALLQRGLLLEFAVQHKQIPRLTYFTCRNPQAITTSTGTTNNDTGNRNWQEKQLRQQLRAAYDAKNVQLIESLYQPYREAARNHPFVRIVLLDVLRQASQAKPRAGSSRGSRGGTRGMAGGTAASARAEWFDSVLKVEALRQIVAVDLACGMLSRRFLEMVSADPTP